MPIYRAAGESPALILSINSVCHSRLHRNVHGGADDFLPRRAQHDVSGFGIEPQIEFAAGSIDELGIVVCGVILAPMKTNSFARPANSGSMEMASARFVIGPPS